MTQFCPAIQRTTTAEGCERRRSLGSCLCRKDRDKEIEQGGAGKMAYKAELDAIIASCVRDGMEYRAISEIVNMTPQHVGTRVYRLRKMGTLEALAI